MTSVNTNAAAITALRTLQQTNNQLDTTQSRISTGLKIGEAKDNAAYWAISTTLKSDNKSLATVKDALGLGSATVDVAYQGLNKAKDVLDEIKSKLTAASQAGVDKNVIQAEITELQKQLVSIAGSSVFSGENWLSVDSSAVDYDATKKIVASFSRDSNNSVTIGTVDVTIGGVALFDSSTVAGKNGILDGAQNLKGSDGKDLLIGGTATSGNASKAGIDAALGPITAQLSNASTPGNHGGASGADGVAAVPVAIQNGTPATASVYTAGAFDATALHTSANNVNFSLAVGSSGAVALQFGTTSNTMTSGDYINAINGAINGSALNGLVEARLGAASAIEFVAKGAALGNTTIAVTAVSSSATASKTGGLATGSNSAGNNAGVATATGTTFNAIGLVSTDKLTFKFKIDGADRTATIAASGPSMNVGNVATALQGLAGYSGFDYTVNSGGGNLQFISKSTGSVASAQLVDTVVTDASDRRKNLDVFANLTESKVGTVVTNSLSFLGLAADDQVSMNLTVDGGKLAVKVAAGTSVTDLAASLNANSTFSAKASAFIDGGALRINSKTTGTSSSVSIDAVSFTTATGVAKTPTTPTNFNNIASSAVAKTAQFASAVTLDDNDNIYFNVQLNDQTGSKLVTINKDLVNKALTVDASSPYTSGVIGNAADYQKVMTAALTKAGVTGLTVTVGTSGGPDENKLLLTTDKIGTDAKVTISNVEASGGANQMSIDKLDISDAGFAKLNVTSGDDIAKVMSAYIAVVNNAINSVTTAASNLGAVASRIDMQKSFVNTLMDTIDKGVGGLIDADMSEESTKLQALQVKQSLGVQALSIANQSSQNILRLFQ